MARERDATSSELRHDWLADRWVIVAPQRTERPFDFVKYVDVPREIVECPFCRGHEASTPTPVASYKRGAVTDPQDWSVRVVPNKFPAVTDGCPDEALAMAAAPFPMLPSENAETGQSIDLFRRRDLSGGHEVIVESPNHLNSISQLSPEDVRLVFRAYRDRLGYWLDERNVCYAVVFKNVGQDAGASLAHTHSQLISTNILPPDVKRSASRMTEYLETEGRCLFCKTVEDELEQKVRVVDQSPGFVAICPFASRIPALVTIYPTDHQSQFESLAVPQLDQLAWLTHRTIRRIEKCYPHAAYNFVIHTAPGCERNSDSFHWRLELFPRLTKVAGFEWGSDCYINPLTPEEAAHSLRQAGV